MKSQGATDVPGCGQPIGRFSIDNTLLVMANPAVLVPLIVLLLYVVSFGAWCRYNRGGPGEIKAASAYVWPYYPMFWLIDNGPAPVKSALRSYVIWCLR